MTDCCDSKISSQKGNDRSPESNVPRSNLILKKSGGTDVLDTQDQLIP